MLLFSLCIDVCIVIVLCVYFRFLLSIGFCCCFYIVFFSLCWFFFFFFFKQKTAYDMRISDWSSDVCSSDLMYVNLIWIWGHPEVYILVLPLFGVFSEVTSTFSGKRLFGYTSMVYATICITILSYIVWLHHFFTMGSGASVNSFFGITTMVISIPTGAKLFNWLFTMYRGRIRFELPMMWTVAFMLTFVIGGMTGVLLAVPPADFVLHNSLFLIAHFHNVIIGGVLFGLLDRKRTRLNSSH